MSNDCECEDNADVMYPMQCECELHDTNNMTKFNAEQNKNIMRIQHASNIQFITLRN